VNEEQAIIVLQVQPKASRSKIVRFEDGILHLRIAALPIKGKANQELVKFLSHVLGIDKSSLTIEKGMTSKRKVVVVKKLTQSQVTRLLKKLTTQPPPKG